MEIMVNKENPSYLDVIAYLGASGTHLGGIGITKNMIKKTKLCQGK